MLYSLQKQIKMETVLATVEKKYATELLEGKGDCFSVSWGLAVAIKQLILDLSQNSKNWRREQTAGTLEPQFHIQHLFPKDHLLHKVNTDQVST